MAITMDRMTRTPHDAARRAGIADASSGYFAPVNVALYANIPPDVAVDPEATLRDLFNYARARDWNVVARHVDRLPRGDDFAEHPGWAATRAAIENGHAQGIVCSLPGMIPPPLSDRDLLANWLGSNDAFAVYSQDGDPTGAHIPDRSRTAESKGAGWECPNPPDHEPTTPRSASN
ncbi:hypothetical protein QMK19_22950 [Streptomyces sp. H10-C2]|uniref:hypothetical protein n=1 Tax=unclassified Streptomyces TaxID=2593676 RepID=UPI0024B9236A|nr:MULTISPECIES: hypothetical protein [unclassified Streptomyces]MDJ0342764.1 hypothetical protein [Streptomyces sp. PH10-H1]MDJ0372442.1 hypothetical protein [Streptomyces sp. H10-C2]